MPASSTSHSPLESRTDWLWAAFHLAALSSFALAQPLFDLLARRPEFLVAHGIRGAELWGLAALLIAAPPLVATASISALGLLSRRLGLAGLAGWLGVFSALIALPATRFLPGDAVQIVAALGIGAIAARFYWRARAVRVFLGVLAPAPAVFAALFLFNSPAATLRSAVEHEWTPASQVERPHPVVLVVFDALPLFSLLNDRGEIAPERFPNFAELARRATWFRNASSVAQQTELAIPALLTGRYPKPGLLQRFEDHPQNLFTLLGGHHRLEVFEIITSLCPRELCEELAAPEPRAERLAAAARDLGFVALHLLLPEEMRARLPDVSHSWRDFGAHDSSEPNARVDARRGRSNPGWLFEHFLHGIGSGSEPALQFLHASVPHPPWRFLPSGKSYGPAGRGLYPYGKPERHWIEDDWAVDRALQRHLLQVGYADHLIGRLVARLRETEAWDETLLVVTADHGESFWPGHPARLIDERNASDLLEVPLFIKLPQQTQGAVDDRNVETIDVLPTIADSLGFELPEAIDGHSLLGDLPPRDHKIAFRGGTENWERLEYDAHLSGRDESVARVQRVFGGQPGWSGLHALGSFPQLRGLAPDSVGVRADEEWSAEVASENAFDDVDLSGSWLPARVAGSLRAPAGREPEYVAVVLNGRIQAVVRTFDAAEGMARFAAMLPEAAFRNGRNELELFAVREEASGVALVPMPTRERRVFTLLEDSEGRVGALRSSRGELFPVARDAFRGQVGEEMATLAGWAVDVARNRVPDSVLVFAGGEFVEEGPCQIVLPRIARRFENPALARSGWSFAIPHAQLEDDPRLRVFAISNGWAGELKYKRNFRWKSEANEPRGALTVRRDASREWLTGDGAPDLAIEAGVSAGTVRLVKRQRFTATFRVETPGATRAVLVFSDGSFVFAQPGETSDREIVLPIALLEDDPTPQLRFFALSDRTVVRELLLRDESD